MPFGVKDLLDVQGVPTTGGSKAFLERKPSADATAVRRLVEAGAVVLGKTNLHECAFGFTGENKHFGDTKNPWDTSRITGGSSSGSALAVALGICPFALGSDTGGSIRHPSALCGLTGLKPTYGRVSRTGGIPLSWTLDHIGPLTRTAAEAAVVLRAMAGRDPADETSSRQAVPDFVEEIKGPIQGLKVGIPHAWFFESLDKEVAAGLTTAIDKLMALGCKMVDVKLPHLEEAVGADRAIIFAEASSYYQPYLRDRAEKFSDDIRALLQAGLFLPAVDYLRGQRAPYHPPRMGQGVCDDRLPGDADDTGDGHEIRRGESVAAGRRQAAGAGLSRYDAAVQPERPSGGVGAVRPCAADCPLGCSWSAGRSARRRSCGWPTTINRRRTGTSACRSRSDPVYVSRAASYNPAWTSISLPSSAWQRRLRSSASLKCRGRYVSSLTAACEAELRDLRSQADLGNERVDAWVSPFPSQEPTMANSNVPQDKRKAKLKRRRREINRLIDKMGDANNAEVAHKARELRKSMRFER